MKSVTERCNELQAQLSRLRTTQGNQEKAKALGVRRGELEARRVELTRLAAASTILVGHGHLGAKQLPAVDKAQQSCVAVRQRLDADPETLTKGRDYSTFIKRLDKLNATLDRETVAAWGELVKKHEGGDERFLRQVEQVPGQAEVVAAIRQARADLDTAAAHLPLIEEQYLHFLSCSEALQQALAKLDPDDFPAEVLRFFKRAQSVGGAPLSLLTDEVRAWLERKAMLDGLRVRFEGEG